MTHKVTDHCTFDHLWTIVGNEKHRMLNAT